VIHDALTFPDQDVHVDDVRSWHIARGWDDCGYHLFLPRDGSVEFGRQLNLQGAHSIPGNDCSVAICLAGGLEHLPDELTSVNQDKLYYRAGKPVGLIKENFTVSQWLALHNTVSWLKTLYPDAIVCGHRDMTRDGRNCPGFSVPEWWQIARGLDLGDGYITARRSRDRRFSR
jgi:N-acetyl-anhydromuramyl-L-alanine amidase AmpD